MYQSKYAKDRRTLRKIDSEAAQQSFPEVLGYLLVFAVLLYPGDIYAENPKITVITGILLLLIAFAKGWSVLRFDQKYSCGPLRWRREFTAMHYLNRVVWSSFVVLIIHFYGLSINTYIVLTFTLGLSAVSIFPWAPYPLVNRVCLTITLIPTVLTFIKLNTIHTHVISVLLAAFYFVFIKQSDYLYFKFWQRVESTEELKQKARDYEVSKSKADQAHSVKIDFLANLTHEIRTPMNSVLGMLSLLGDTRLSKEQEEFQQVATSSGESLLSLIDDILDFSQLSSGKVVLDSQVFNIRKCIGEVLELHGPVAHAKGIELSSIYDPDIPLRVRCDPARLAQVIGNLVSNAIKFSNEGEVIVEVHMTHMGNGEGLLRLHVIDQGIGVSKEQHEKLFKGFSLIDGSSTRKNSGTGLGLAICKGLVECMDGQVGIISELGKGSTFWFTAKLRLSTQQAHQIFHTKNIEDKKVLVVNAAEGCSRGLVYELEAWGMHCEEIDDYDKALQVLRTTAREECAYSLVILDMGLSYQNTLKLSRIISEDPVLKEIKQIVLTTLVQRGSNQCVYHKSKVENLEYVTKPISQTSLWEALTALYDLHKGIDKRVSEPKKIETDHKAIHRVLLVEDNKVNQMVAKGMLKRLGYAVKIVNNGKEALGIIEDKQFDIILMDCQMPELDGYETTREIREREKNHTAHIPIVAMTANAMEGEEAKCLAAGMDDYLSKPVNVDELDAKLRLWLGNTNHASGIIQTNQASGPALH